MITIDVEDEKKEIVRRYRRLLRRAKPFLKEGDSKIIRRAFNTALDAHKDMRRRTGEPYIYHPLEVAVIAIDEIGLGTTAIVAALLHDVVEDTELEIADVRRDFGPKVAKIIDGLTKISGVFEQGTSEQAENFRKMLLTLSDDVRVILIKLADRLHNMRTLASMPQNKQLKIASETMYIYAPLAHRLGLYSIKTELEDLWLKYTESEQYHEITRKIVDTEEARNKFVKRFIRPIRRELKTQDLNFEIKGRTKSIYSIWNKMRKQNIPFEEVYDLFAIRIILNSKLESEKADCWKVYSIVTDFYQPNPDRLRDWISTPKGNGYESLHTTVMSSPGKWVEVQIRTRRMDDIAEKGYAAHWKYKDSASNGQSSRLERWISGVREMLEQSDSSAIEFVDDFRSNLFHEEVFVFTPKGELRTLPHGATALDFAFEIHTEIGARCLGAKVNQKLVPLNHLLKNGDQVEVLTSKKQKPSEDWLRFVVSSKARSKIKDALKEERKAAAAEGKEIVKRKLRQMKLKLNNETVEQLRAYFDERTVLDFYYKVGKGTIDAKAIKNFKEARSSIPKDPNERIEDAASFTKQKVKVRQQQSDMLLIGEDMDVVDYRLAKCCNPIPGDEVFGFVTVNEGIKIHRTSCPNAPELLSNYGYRVVKAKWSSQMDNAFLTDLKIIGTDRLGLINDVTSIISGELNVNMRAMSIATDQGIFEGKITLYVQDTGHLEVMIRRLQKVNGVVKVTRIDTTK